MENADFTPEKLEQAKLLADTAAGRQLKELLQQTNAKGLRQAMEQVAQGDYASAKGTIEAFLETPEAAALLRQLRDNL